MLERFLFVDLAVPSVAATGDGIFTYAIPTELSGELSAGQLVRIHLRRKLEPGVIVRLHDDEPDFDLRPIDSCVEPPFVLPDRAGGYDIACLSPRRGPQGPRHLLQRRSS